MKALFILLCAATVLLAGDFPLDGYNLPMQPGRWQIIATSNANAAQVYKIDTATGQTYHIVSQDFLRSADNQPVTAQGWKLIPMLADDIQALATVPGKK